MKPIHFKIITMMALVMELLLLTYVAYMAYFLSSWFLDDSFAATLTNSGWTKIAIQRIILFAVIGAIFSGILYFINSYLFRRAFSLQTKKKTLLLSIIVFLSILIPSIIGAVRFAIEKPFI